MDQTSETALQEGIREQNLTSKNMQTFDGINWFLLFLNKLSFSKADVNQKLKEAQMNLPRAGP